MKIPTSADKNKEYNAVVYCKFIKSLEGYMKDYDFHVTNTRKY